MSSSTNLPPGPVSNRALAKLLGLKSDNAVRVALRTGRLRRCVVPGGLDPAIAFEEWTATTDPRQQRFVTEHTDAAAASDRKARGKGKTQTPSPGRPSPKAKGPAPCSAPPAAARPAPEPSPAAAERLAAHVAANRAKASPPPQADDAPDGDGRTMADIRKSLLLIEERDREHDWAVKRGSFVPREQVLMFAQSLGREFRDSTLQLADQYAAQISADLGVDEHACHTVLDRYMRAHFEAVIKVISTDKILSGEEAEAEEADDLADAPEDPDRYDTDEEDA